MPDRLADAVLLLHLGIVVFILGGLLVIWLGYARDWSFVQARSFRLLHLGAIWFVTVETLLGLACPLTLLEDQLRGTAAQSGGFIERWIRRILYWDLPWWVFALSYLLFALAVTATYVRLPPRRTRMD